MERKIYYLLFKIIKVAWLAQLLSKIITGIFKNVVLFMCQIGFWRNKSLLSSEEARRRLNAFSIKPQCKTEFTVQTNINRQLSIIIPAYNVQDTIVRCVESVLRQKTTIDYEVIVVNDGSKDSTLRMLEPYKKDPRVTVVSQNNKGLSGARNTGICMAHGAYVTFLDSDDEMGKNAIESLMRVALQSGAYIVGGSYETVYKDQRSLKSNVPDKVYDTSRDDTGFKALSGFAWGKVFRKSLFDEIRFPEGYLFEDTIMLFLIYRIAKGKVIATVSDVVYRYFKNEKGITATYRSSPKCVHGYWIVEKMVEETKRIGLPWDEKLFQLVYGHLSLAYWRTRTLDRKLREAIFILSCELMDQVLPAHQGPEKSEVDRRLIEAYKTRSFQQWNVLCALK